MADPKSLPPLHLLRAFAAAGRLQNFRDAAAELGVTPSAVSHQIKTLETWIGAPLFDRGVRQVRLNERGKELSRAVNRSLAALITSLEQARRGAARTSLKVAALPLFVSAWMAPRLERFERLHPDLSLTIHTDARVYDVLAGEADVAIRNVATPGSGLYARKLLDLRATPLCTPALAEDIVSPNDLRRKTLIALSVGRAGWTDWLERAGYAGLKPRRLITVDTLPEAIAAAAQGRGVMLGLLPLIWDAAGASALVAPFNLAPQEAGAYYVVCRKEDRSNTMAAAFISWLLDEMKADAHRLKRLERTHLAPHRRG
ncbi:MAG: LysR substrate-binding domain-containing protein [Hyphomonadaceae bacterium]|nr:LysR substrate-binding domain-containing protein [Hyphomonadaceae bacterium]